MSRRPQANSRSQPTSQVRNLSGGRHQVGTDGIRTASLRSGMQQTQSGGSPSTLLNEQPSHLRPTPQNTTRVLGRPPKHPRRRTIQSTTYNDIETEPDAQALTETIRLQDDSSDEYQNSLSCDQTESDTEPDMEDNISKNIPCTRCAAVPSGYQARDISAHDARSVPWLVATLACARYVRGSVAIPISLWTLLVT